MEEAITIPGYQIKREIGRGGMASVYCAVQESLNRDVALKIMSLTLVGDDSFRQRFVNEGRIIAQLLHPNIVTIFDIGVYQQYYYLAMELLSGDTLKQRIQSGLEPTQVVTITKALGKALGHAHQRGFIHRDIKPANVLFRDDDTLVLTDFGIAKTLNAATQMTAAGYTLGSTGYMSPEQALGKPLDSRSDLYSVGILFWEMLTKTMPYNGEDAFAVALKHATEPVPTLPPELAIYQPILDRLMAKSPTERFASAGELVAALEVFEPQSNSGSQQTLVLGANTAPSGTQTIIADEGPASKAAKPIETSTTIRQALSWVGAGAGLLLAAAGFFWMINQPPPAPVTQANITPVVEPKPTAAPMQAAPMQAAPNNIEQPRVEVEQNDPQTVDNRAKPVMTEPVLVEEKTVNEPAPAVGQVTNESALTAEPVVNETVSAVGRIANEPVPVSKPEQEQARPAQELSVQQLLAQASQQWQAQQFFEPAGSNAFETYRRVLEIEPLNQEARDGMINIGRVRLGIQYEQAAQQLVDANELSAALEKINVGLRLAPDYVGLIELRKQIQSQSSGDQ